MTPENIQPSSAEVTALQAEVDSLREQNAELASSSSKRRRFNGRAFSSVVLIVIAALLLPFAIVAFWGQKTVVDTTQYVNTVSPLSQDPTIRLAVGDAISKQLRASYDLEAQVQTLLPDKAKPLAPPITNGIYSYVDDQIAAFLASDAFSSLWVSANQAAQKGLIKALSGDQTGAITVQGDQVVLDTGVLLQAVKDRLVARGLTIVANVPIPAAADREIVLLTSAELKQLRTIYSFTQPVAQWLIFAVAFMFAGAILLARRRSRALVAVGLVIAVDALVVRLAMSIGEATFVDALSTTAFASASTVFYTTIVTYLIAFIRTLFVLGLLLALIGWFIGDSPSSIASRTWLSTMLSGGGARVKSLAGVGAWVKPRRTWLRAVVIAVGALTLIAADRISGAILFWTLVAVLVGIGVIEFLAGAAAPDGADDSDLVDETLAASSTPAS